MKRILSLIMLLVAAVALVACEEVDGSLEITQFPATEYYVGHKEAIIFGFAVDDTNLYMVTWTPNEVGVGGKYTYTLGGDPVQEAIVKAGGISITPMDLSTTGVKTVVIKYNKLRAQFQYEVKPTELVVGDGSLSNPFRIYSANDLVEKLVNADASKMVYLKLESDLDLSEKTSLQISVNKISIDGEKALGGNYKLSNLNDTLFDTVVDLTLKNIDFVDAVTTAHIVGMRGTNVTIDNVNILGNSFTSEAAYFDKLEGNSFILNSSNYATVVSREGTSAAFARRLDVATSVLTIRNSFNYGTIQTADNTGRTGGFVTTSGKGKVVIENSANKGKVQFYVTETDATALNNYYNVNKGAYTFVGHNPTSGDQAWVHLTTTPNPKVQYDAASLANSNAPEFITTKSAGLALNSNTITASLSAEVVSYRLVMFASGSDHVVTEASLEAAKSGGGNINIYDKMGVPATSGVTNLITLNDIVLVLQKPYASKGLGDAPKSNGSITVSNAVVVDGYNIYDGGKYRIVNPKASDTTSVKVMIYGYDAQNNLVSASNLSVSVSFLKT